jgi:hypothetical protein
MSNIHNDHEHDHNHKHEEDHHDFHDEDEPLRNSPDCKEFVDLILIHEGHDHDHNDSDGNQLHVD